MNKYLIVSPYPPPYLGGHLVYLSMMVANCNEGFDILTNSLPDGQREIIGEKDKAIRRRFIRSMFKEPTLLENIVTYSYVLFWIFLKSLGRKYSAIIVNWAPAPNSFVHLFGRLLGVPTIGILLGEEITVTLKTKGLKGVIKRVLMKCGYKRADGFIACCNFIKDRAVEIGVDPKIIYVIPISYNPKNTIFSGKKKERGFNIISVGTVVERKGFHLLVDAVYMLKDELPQIKLNIVGDGPFMPVVKERVKRYGLDDRVIFHGRLFEEQLSKLFEACDLFVLANRMLDDGNTEGAPLTIADASSHGLPVIGGTGGGVAMIVDDGVTGYIVDSGNINELAGRIKEILTSPDLAYKMGQAGKEKVKRDHDPVKAGQLFGESVDRLARKLPPSDNQAATKGGLQ